MRLPLLIAVFAGMGTLAGAQDTLPLARRALDVRSPCEPREPPLSTCSEFAAACVAYFNSPAAPTDTLRKSMVDEDARSCIEWKSQCVKSGMWQGPNCVIINIQRR
jgi:hypothetical protein